MIELITILIACGILSAAGLAYQVREAHWNHMYAALEQMIQKERGMYMKWGAALHTRRLRAWARHRMNKKIRRSTMKGGRS